jgi:hypothetical protein
MTIGLAASIATSQPTYELTGTASLRDIALNADQPDLALTLALTGTNGMKVNTVSFVQLDLDAENFETSSGLIELYVLDAPFDGTLPEGLEPQSSANVRGALADEPAIVTVGLYGDVEGADELYLVVHLVGDAELEGDLAVTVGKISDEPMDGKLQVEVVQ